MFVFAARSQCGARHVRNDDRIFVMDDVLVGAEEPGSYVERQGTCDSDRMIVCTFDGVGGSVRGDLAALSAAESLKTTVRERSDLSLAETLQTCSDEVAEGQEGMAHNERAYTVGAGCRFKIDDDGTPLATPFHMGDCRVYHYRAPGFGSLTRDHSLANRYRDELGPDVEIPPKIAHVVTSYAGGDIPSPFELGETFQISEADLFLCASDGLWEHIDQDLLEGFLSLADPRDKASLGVALRSICRAALESGSPDDISGVLVGYVQDVAADEDCDER
ncbi:MAG: hypothetical protein Q4F23_04305 [Coriobacteriia bacterium]|nr:hypothetical protein [Coriobacteriia bacterium]